MFYLTSTPDIRAWARHRCDVLFGEEMPLEYVLETPALRRMLTRRDPLLFAWIYLPGSITDDQGRISFAAPHIEWCELARQWSTPITSTRVRLGIAEWRHAFIAMRETGKTTWWFLLIPMWALAHGHARFIAAFANMSGQAEQHLATFKRELDTNALLRADFPELCSPARRPTGTSVADRQGMLHCGNGAIFAAKGIDSASLGMKVGNTRPDVLILDDLEPDEARYSQLLAEKRLGTLREAILPLNIRARVVLVGTVTMPNSITHQLVKASQGVDERELDWVREDNFQTHHQQPLILTDDGDEVSAWPEKWPTEWLQARRHTRDFAKNYLNDPLARDGDYWTADDIRVGLVPALTHQLLSIDPAVTTKEKSDFTALAVVGYSASQRKTLIRYARAMRIPPGEQLRTVVLHILDLFPDIVGVLIETNQGGDTWKAILHDLPVKIKTIHQTVPKEVRAADLLAHYQHGNVIHEDAFPALVGQLVAFPKGAHDDLVDAVGAGVAVFLGQKRKAGAKQAAYV